MFDSFDLVEHDELETSEIGALIDARFHWQYPHTSCSCPVSDGNNHPNTHLVFIKLLQSRSRYLSIPLFISRKKRFTI